jgi:hypothetical protein
VSATNELAAAAVGETTSPRTVGDSLPRG